MKIKIKRFDKDIPLPKRETEGAAAFDLRARTTTTIAPKQIGYIPLNVAIATPPGHFLLVAARSGTHKRGLMPAHGIGIGDPDFSGDGDEYKAIYYNFTDQPVTVERGDRIAQGVFVPIIPLEWVEVDRLDQKTRGGFGTTGNA